MRVLFFVLTCLAIEHCGLSVFDTRWRDYRPSSSAFEVERRQFEEVGKALRAWHDAHGRWPTNDEGLSVLVEAGVRVLPPFANDLEKIEGVHALLKNHMCSYISRSEYVPMRCDAGPLSPEVVPFLYENRRDGPPEAFAGSPLDGDPDRKRLEFFRDESGVPHCGYEIALWPEIAKRLGRPGFSAARTFDLVLAVTLRVAGVERFFTRNVRDFRPFGLFEIIDPLTPGRAR